MPEVSGGKKIVLHSRSKIKSLLNATAVASLLVICPSQLWAEEIDLAALKKQMAEQEELLKKQSAILQQYQSALSDQQQKIDQLQEQFDASTVGYNARVLPASYVPGTSVQASGQAQYGSVATVASDQIAQGNPNPAPPGGEPKDEERPDVPILSDKGGVLLPAGNLVLEPSLEYSQNSTLRAQANGFTVVPAILIGSFDVSDAEQETVTAALTARYGITDRLEIEGKLPYIYREDTIRSRELGTGASNDQITGLSSSDIGDAELALHYQINDGKDNWPFLVGNLRYKSRTGKDPFEVDLDSSDQPTELATGTGFHSFEPSITFIKPTDPAVIFGNFGYTYNVGRDVGGTFGDIDPGDSINGSIGVGFALNEQIALNMAYDHDWILPTTQNGDDINEDIQVGRALFGGSYQLDENISINTTLGIGVTEDAPDLSFQVRVPVRFDLKDVASELIN